MTAPKPAYVYDGTQWVPLATAFQAPVSVQNEEPTTPSVGQLWVFDSDEDFYSPEYNYSSTQPPSPATGTLWVDTTVPEAPVIKTYDGTDWVISGGVSGPDYSTTFMFMGV